MNVFFRIFRFKWRLFSGTKTPAAPPPPSAPVILISHASSSNMDDQSPGFEISDKSDQESLSLLPKPSIKRKTVNFASMAVRPSSSADRVSAQSHPMSPTTQSISSRSDASALEDDHALPKSFTLDFAVGKKSDVGSTPATDAEGRSGVEESSSTRPITPPSTRPFTAPSTRPFSPFFRRPSTSSSARPSTATEEKPKSDKTRHLSMLPSTRRLHRRFSFQPKSMGSLLADTPPERPATSLSTTSVVFPGTRPVKRETWWNQIDSPETQQMLVMLRGIC